MSSEPPRYRYLYKPGSITYRSRRIKWTPRMKAVYRQILAEAEAYRRAKFPEYYRDRD